MAKKKAVKKQQPKQNKVIQRLVRRDKAELRQKEGWKIVPVARGHWKDELADVILMEKSV